MSWYKFCARLIVTGGQQETQTGGWAHVPKRDLMVRLQTLLREHRLRFAHNLRFGAELLKEMSDMRVKMTPAGTETYGAWREGSHDDMVFAVALACWRAQKVWGPALGGGYWGEQKANLWDYLI